MSAKVTEDLLDRMVYLRNQGLTQEVIGTRLGITSRTVRLYLAMVRDGKNPFVKEAENVPSDSL